ncbi:phenylacetate--CoA ligase [Acetobacterium wieringae]|uniref:Phenylacetate-coenzyme A ligase n=1 Tax=Acetobacterium wieringae TaxID=52694 RepID=A0A1F2PII2_9FIRM|nr:phenylacetate--CoA ligase [Acetobacterium wieringae]OFV71138.1 phenylacetate-coenzyme A ligase [Acetobacterium wieringae]URN83928.1 phenylacetate--CoA ligase [Acetobacterium wieringae]UYO62384.1 phenylacetate--CoA ligase [Acetobacterium wieringae]VUZ26570.1 Phenylacetate-coenzyme A ligase [Acetobacterium wieringae]
METLKNLQALVKRLEEKSPFYQQRFKAAGIVADDINTMADFEQLPFTDKGDLRNAYPLGLQAVPDSEVVRIHSSSGTTGQPVIIPYTASDVADWAEMFARCYHYAGMTDEDRIQITPGYGLWTAGIGFQAGAEKMGAMAIPMGPGNTQKQLQMMVDLKATVLASTSSYALLLAEEVANQNLGDQIHLKRGVIGSERWGDKMRSRIAEELGIELFDIYGLTEIYGPGISIDCSEHDGLHYWSDYLYFEILDQETLKPVPEGEYGELVITTFRKEGAPLLRYRTHDITRFIPGPCACGSVFPRHDRIIGRTDDMVKVKGVNIYPGQIDELLKTVAGVSSEYLATVDHQDGKDRVVLAFEVLNGIDQKAIEEEVKRQFKSRVGLSVIPQASSIGSLPRSEKKSIRIIDRRFS